MDIKNLYLTEDSPLEQVVYDKNVEGNYTFENDSIAIAPQRNTIICI